MTDLRAKIIGPSAYAIVKPVTAHYEDDDDVAPKPEEGQEGEMEMEKWEEIKKEDAAMTGLGQTTGQQYTYRPFGARGPSQVSESSNHQRQSTIQDIW